MATWGQIDKEKEARENLKRFDAAEREREDRQLEIDIREACSTKGGRRVLLLILDDLCGVNRPASSQECDKETFMRLGARNVGLRIAETVEGISPAILANARQERREAGREREERRKPLLERLAEFTGRK